LGSIKESGTVSAAASKSKTSNQATYAVETKRGTNVSTAASAESPPPALSKPGNARTANPGQLRSVPAHANPGAPSLNPAATANTTTTKSANAYVTIGALSAKCAFRVNDGITKSASVRGGGGRSVRKGKSGTVKKSIVIIRGLRVICWSVRRGRGAHGMGGSVGVRRRRGTVIG